MIVLVTVTSQMRPSPPALLTPLLHVVVGAIVVAADAGALVDSDTADRSVTARSAAKMKMGGRRMWNL